MRHVAMLLFLSLLAGCGGSDRVIVSGQVTYQGTPVKEGTIRFLPKEGTEAPSSGGVIIDGQYTIDAKGGVPPGTHQVWIEAFRPDPRFAGKKLPPDLDSPPRQQFLPEKFNRNSQLELTVSPGGEPVSKDFHLK